ncbi:MAG: type IV secretory system conjugative DNA transfer family protein [Erysipelotrichaceae bacterium]|nr:type IV secretory system conjugative DNA transfer family protein [Erysipelotrichaceae bacterium]
MDYNYETDWKPYVFPNERRTIVSPEYIKEHYTKVNLNEPISKGGIPIMSEGDNLYVDDSEIMNLIYGSTGSGKTRRLLALYIILCAKAHESMIIPDIKGELSHGSLSSKIRGVLDEEGYRCVYLDFRDMMSDGFNVLHIPYQLYKEGQIDEAMKMVSDVSASLNAIYGESKADPFWNEAATQVFEGLVGMLFETCNDPQYVNMQTLLSYLDFGKIDDVKSVLSYVNDDVLWASQLKAYFDADTPKTLSSVLVVLTAMLKPFVVNQKLSNMLSATTFDVNSLYARKTALFIILPDENDTYKRISGIILQQINSALILAAYKHGGVLPRRINFICDEFCNVHIPNMAPNISASRSRNIRWTMVCQSKRQLENAYGGTAAVIEANCDNVYLLRTKEIALADELSSRAGTTEITPNGAPKPVISAQDLMNLKKDHIQTQALFQSPNANYITSLIDIDQYDALKKYTKKYSIPQRQRKPMKIFTLREVQNSLCQKRFKKRFDIDEENIFDLFDDDNY